MRGPRAACAVLWQQAHLLSTPCRISIPHQHDSVLACCVAQLDLGNYAWALGKAFAELATLDSDVREEDRETCIIRYISNGHPARLPVLHWSPSPASQFLSCNRASASLGKRSTRHASNASHAWLLSCGCPGAGWCLQVRVAEACRAWLW